MQVKRMIEEEGGPHGSLREEAGGLRWGQMVGVDSSRKVGGRRLQVILSRSLNAEETRNVGCLLYRDMIFVFFKVGSLEQLNVDKKA